MANIPKEAIKKLIKRKYKVMITDDAAAELARLLERQATKISRFAVKNAKKAKRNRVTRLDVNAYVLKSMADGDDD